MSLPKWAGLHVTIAWITPYLYASPLPRLHHLYIMSPVIIVEL